MTTVVFNSFRASLSDLLEIYGTNVQKVRGGNINKKITTGQILLSDINIIKNDNRHV